MGKARDSSVFFGLNCEKSENIVKKRK